MCLRGLGSRVTIGWDGMGWDGSADKKSVRVSEAALSDVADHLRDHVLPFLESYQDLCDLNEVMMMTSSNEGIQEEKM